MGLIKKIKCRDLGMDCDYVAKAFTSGGAKKKMMKHGDEVHAEQIKQMSDQDKMGMETKMDEILKGGNKQDENISM